MEQNRNLDFDSDVEVESLKDAVWRLTTRVYLLEDFIAERFGETLGPAGFAKTKSPAPASHPSTSQVCKVCNCPTVVRDENVPHSQRKRKLGKRLHGTDGTDVTGSEQGSSKVQKSQSTADTFKIDPLSVPDVPHLSNLESIEKSLHSPDALLIPKDEMLVPDLNDTDYDDDFLNDKSDDDENPNDSRKHLETDPDFMPSVDTSSQSQSQQTKSKKKRLGKDGKESGGREKSVIVTHTWMEVEIGEEELKAWQLRQKYNYKNFKTEYFNCSEGGRKCPAKLKCITLSADASKTYTTNGLEHNHPRTKSGMSAEQKTTITDLLRENRDITPLIVLEVLKHKGIEIPTSTQVANFLRYKRRKMKQKTEIATAPETCE